MDVMERTLPHNLDAERAVIGAVLISDQALLDVAGMVTAEEFFRAAHRRIFEAILTLAAGQKSVDFVMVKDALSGSGELDEIGGPAYLASLMDGVPKSSNVVHYAGIVREKARLRSLILGANAILADAYEADEDSRTVLDRAEQTLFSLSQGGSQGGFKPLRAILPKVMEQLEAWSTTKTGISGVPSGFADLDAMTRGFQPGNLVIVAARPAMGKSALAQNVAHHVAGIGLSVGTFSLEMSELELGVRTLTAAAHIDGHRLQQGRIYGQEWGRLSQAIEDLAALKFFINDAPFLTAFDMRSQARRLKASEGLDLLIVDYTQLMLGEEGDRRENRTIELAGITRALKGLAKELNIPVLALSQLSRKVEERQDKRPMLSDLRESGSLEQDADVVIFIFRESVYKETDENRGVAELIIGKQRNGPIGTVRVAWIPEETRFANLNEHGVPEDRHLPYGERS